MSMKGQTEAVGTIIGLIGALLFIWGISPALTMTGDVNLVLAVVGALFIGVSGLVLKSS